MALYALIYGYIHDSQIITEYRPEHRAYLRTLADAGSLILAGPLGAPGSPGGLLVFDVQSAADVEQIADNDPFHTHGVIADRTIHEWTLSIGVHRLENGSD